MEDQKVQVGLKLENFQEVSVEVGEEAGEKAEDQRLEGALHLPAALLAPAWAF